MVTDTQDKPSVVDKARATVASRSVFIRAANATGVVPMERRLPDGTKHISRCDYNPQGKMINKVMVRPLDFGANGIMVLNPADYEDRQLLDECKLWIEDGSDPRIALLGISIQEGGNAEGTPFPLYDRLNGGALIKRMTEDVDYLADDPEAVRGFLDKCARYELQRAKPRKTVLDAIEDLGVAAGIEYGTDAVEEL